MEKVTAEELEALRHRLRSFCYQMLGSPFDAEDAVQDVMERAWRARQQYDSGRSGLPTWCLRIARNVCIDPAPRDRVSAAAAGPAGAGDRCRRSVGSGAGRAVADAGTGRLVR